MDFASATAFRAHTTFYEPDSSKSIAFRSEIDWTGESNLGNYEFQATDYISLRYSGSGDYPATDCIFTAAIAMPLYFTSVYFRFAFGVQESSLINHIKPANIPLFFHLANYLVIYQFPTTSTTVADLSGNEYTGTISIFLYFNSNIESLTPFFSSYRFSSHSTTNIHGYQESDNYRQWVLLGSATADKRGGIFFQV